MTATLTAAEKYAQLKETTFEDFLNKSFSEEALKGVDLFEVKCPSGMDFKCRKLDVEYFKTFGQMPVALSAQILEKGAGGAEETPEEKEQKYQQAFQQMTPIQRRAAIQNACQMLRYIAVEPRLIVGEVNGHKNAISVDVLTQADFNYLSKWAGGDAAQGLKTFRRKRR